MPHAPLPRSQPKSEQNAIDAVGLKQWLDWEARNAASFADRGGMVGKAKRVSKDGIADAVNPLCGYVVGAAESIEAAARLFESPPHFSVFPGDGVGIMPFVTEPAS